jgi:energy-coupling factor transporter ATP-binding protein EcfA2
LIRFLPLKSQFVLSGNVRDLQLTQAGENAIPQPLIAFLTNELRAQGFHAVIGYDPVSGFRILTLPSDAAQHDASILAEVGLTAANGVAPAGLELFAETLQRIVERSGPPIALIADFASRLTIRTDNLLPAEQQSFTRALVASHSVRARPHGTPSRPFFNTVLWITEKEGDLPDWLIVDNPRIRHIPIAKPDSLLRRGFATSLLRGLSGFREAVAAVADSATEDFVDETEGLLLMDMQAIAQLARTESVGFSAISDAVRRYKVGVTEDPWMRIDREKVRNAADFIRSRVKGQDHAITHILDIVKRAVTGVGAPRRGGRPRGVAFLAGPTGVGKTELAKTITSLLFGDESAYIRFDMSEFSAEHSDQRLIGAPPGYVGYDVGGELTNSVREKPFSVVLFDEIEKAHPRILDKFLQVLDDGVLTSGRGDRVYFSESFIIFTSNLGIYRNEPSGERVPNVTAANSFAEVRNRVRSEIDAHFKVVLNRPELLNRIGENIIVFDFIRDEVAHQIFDGMVRMALDDLRMSQNISVSIGPISMSKLRDRCLADLSNGGRGIRNQVEVHLLNPLARALFDANAEAGASMEIIDLDFSQTTNLVLTRNDSAK